MSVEILRKDESPGFPGETVFTTPEPVHLPLDHGRAKRTDLLGQEVRDRLGILPNFFCLAPEAPEITATIWSFAKLGYLDNPLPSLFKERLFVYLSRFCKVRYCIARHIGFLVGLGRPAGDTQCPPQTIEQAVRLARKPFPRNDELESHLLLLERNHSSSLDELLICDSPQEHAVINCAAHLFLQSAYAPRCLKALQHALGEIQLEHLSMFLTFVRTAHYWTMVHPELHFEDDINQLLATHEDLAQCILNDPEAALPDQAERIIADRGESEQRFRAVIDALPAAIYTTDAKGKITHFNPACIEFSGRTPTLGSDHWCITWKLFHPDGRPMPHDECPMAIALKEKRVISGAEAIAERPDGTRIWFMPYPMLQFDNTGELIGGVNMLVDITERKAAEARIRSDADALTKLNELSSRLWNTQSLREGLDEMLAATVELLGADFGNIQILDSQRRVLLIEAQRGFQKEFLDFFREVAVDDGSSCGRALRTGERIIVEDVETDPDFAALLHIVRNAGYRAVQSTPIIGQHGRLLGMISTHFRSVHRPSENELRLLDLYVRQAANFIEHKRAESLIEDQKQSLELMVAGAPLEGDGGILDFLARSMERQLDGALVAIHLMEPDVYHFGYVAAPNLPPKYAEVIRGIDAREELSCCSSAVVSNTAMIVRDFAGDPARTRWPIFTAEMMALGLRSCFTTPIVSAETGILGTFAIYYREPRDPQLRERQLIDFVIRTVALAIERKRAEKVRRESEERFRMLADNMAQLAWTSDKLGNVNWYNQRWLEYTGMSFAEMNEWGWTKCHHPDHVERVIASITRSRETGEIWEDTFPLRARNGSYRWFLSRALPIRDANGEIACWFATSTDIEDLKQAREAAETANRVKDEFLATVSHELRTPLNAIMGWVDLLTRGNLDEETFARGLETIARNASAQNQLISDLLDISRIISGQLRFENGVVDLLPVIEAAAQSVRPAADSKGIVLQLQLDSDAGLVSGDGMRLQQIVWNLLSNAIKFTPRGGHVTVWLKREYTSVVLTVSDTGEGISSEFLPYIFDRFRQAESTAKGRHGGLGLGLAIVRHLVEAHGGTIRGSSKGIGNGATFTVTFPLLGVHRDAEAEAAFFQPASTAFASPILNGLRVLVIDDEEDARELLTIALTQSGADVRTAATVREALEILSQWKPHVLVSDIGMPGENGYDLIRRVRALESENGGTIPALALTGYASAEDAARTRVAGYQTHMAKPVPPGDLILAVASLAAEAGVYVDTTSRA